MIVIINTNQSSVIKEHINSLFGKDTLNESKNVVIYYEEMSYDPNSIYQNIFFNKPTIDGEIDEDTETILIRKKGSNQEFKFKKNQVKQARSGGYYVSARDFYNLLKDEIKQPNVTDIKSISKEEMSSLIKKVLSNVFTDNWKKGDEYYTPGLRDIYTIGEKTGNKDETWSIMNYFDTKQEIHKMILDKFKNDKNDKSLEDWMKDMFKNDKRFVETLVNRQWQSIKNGVESENKLTNILISKFPNAKIQTFLPGSRMDRFQGVDIIINGIKLQIKPLGGIEKRDNHYLVSTYGMKDMYKQKSLLDYIAYVGYDGEIILFPNKNYYLVGSNSVKHYSNPTDLESLM